MDKPHTREEVLEELKKKYDPEARQLVASDAKPLAGSDRVDQLALPIEQRKKMPMTKDRYVVRENVNLVAWEREVRVFLRQLTLSNSHRISAVMVFEWVTGLSVSELVAKKEPPNADLRHINKCLKFYFGKPYMTYIGGRKVPKAYRVPLNWMVKKHRPMTLSLYVEYTEGTLNP